MLRQEFPKQEYAGRVIALRDTYRVLSLRAREWLAACPGSEAVTDDQRRNREDRESVDRNEQSGIVCENVLTRWFCHAGRAAGLPTRYDARTRQTVVVRGCRAVDVAGTVSERFCEFCGPRTLIG